MATERATKQDNDKLSEVKFHFFTMLFTPLKDFEHLSSNDILLKIVELINEQRSKRNIIIYDRYRNRKNTPQRELYVSYARHIPGKRINFTMALIRSGKQPLLKKSGSIELIPFDKDIGDFTDVTHFYVDMNRPIATVCVEFNYNGPRMSDIEYYFRAITTDFFKLSRSLSVNMLIESDIEETVNNLAGILNFDIKIEGKRFSAMDEDTKPFLQQWGLLLTKLQPEFIRVEAFFQRQGKKINKPSSNPGMINGIKTILKGLSKTNNSEAFDKFVVNYQDNGGNEQKFDLFDKKSEIIVHADLNKEIKNTAMYNLIKDKLDEFLTHRYDA
jgi:hypothetical protein